MSVVPAPACLSRALAASAPASSPFVRFAFLVSPNKQQPSFPRAAGALPSRGTLPGFLFKLCFFSQLLLVSSPSGAQSLPSNSQLCFVRLPVSLSRHWRLCSSRVSGLLQVISVPCLFAVSPGSHLLVQAPHPVSGHFYTRLLSPWTIQHPTAAAAGPALSCAAPPKSRWFHQLICAGRVQRAALDRHSH